MAMAMAMAMQYILQSYKEKIYRFYFTSFHNTIDITTLFNRLNVC